MIEFIAHSDASKNALNMATIASTLPVAVLIFGEVGVGKKTLAHTVAPDAILYDALEFQDLLYASSIKLEDFEVLILSDIDRVNNIKQFIEKLERDSIKVVATATQEKESFSEKFAVRIDLHPLNQRSEDLVVLGDNYLKEANRLFNTDVQLDAIKIDFSQNCVSLKESIYRGVIFDSISEEQIAILLEKFLLKQMEQRSQYKELLEIFEIPLIKASRTKYKSQLQMAGALNINRNTLRKKINQYGLEE